jgi:peptidoglycan-N-acetylglucosamine deacetylase
MFRSRLRVAALVLSGVCACHPSASPPSLPADGFSPKARAVESPRPAPLVAVTFDDLPAHGPLAEGQTILDVHRRLLDVLAAHHVPQVYGFINGAKAETEPDGRRVLELWRDSGQPLGNHTWSHPDLGKVGAEAFVHEIERNDALLAELVGDGDAARRARRVFRYPYLHQGTDRAMLDAVRSYLGQNGYRIAEVTIDFGDWAYNPAYVRCSRAHAEPAVSALTADIRSRGVESLRWSEDTARAIWGQSIPHILLMHSGSFDAQVLDALLSDYEAAGVRWITLEQALEHPAYHQDVRVPSPSGGTLLEQLIERDSLAHPPFMIQPIGLLEQLCRGS